MIFNWIFGLLFSLASSVCGSLSIVCLRGSSVIKQSIDDSEEAGATPVKFEGDVELLVSKNDVLPKFWYKLVPRYISVSQLWMVGMLLASVIGPVLSAVSVALAPAAVVIATAPVGLVLNILFARLMLNEHVTRLEALGCVLISIGIFHVLQLSDKSVRTFEDLVKNLNSVYSLTFLGVFSVMFILSMIFAIPMALRPRPWKRTGGILFSITAGIACGTTTLSGRTLFTAFVVRNITASILSLVALVTMAIVDLTFMAKSLECAPAVLAAPLRTAVSFAVGTAGSVFMLGEFPYSPIHFFIAALLALFGVFCLTIRNCFQIESKVEEGLSMA